MPQKTEPLEHEKYYHIYNRGINRETLFREPDNYRHFLRLYDEYIDLIAETFAWCLMPNHFHLLVRIKEEEEIDFLPVKGSNADRSGRPCQVEKGQRNGNTNDLSGSARPDRVSTGKKPTPIRQFSHLFNAYTKAFNKSYNRHGALFERPFRRIHITNEKYFRNMVCYIHNNPVKHAFVEDMSEYPWTSYLSIISVKPTKIQREEVLGWFDSENDFKLFHKKQHEENEIEMFIID